MRLDVEQSSCVKSWAEIGKPATRTRMTLRSCDDEYPFDSKSELKRQSCVWRKRAIWNGVVDGWFRGVQDVSAISHYWPHKTQHRRIQVHFADVNRSNPTTKHRSLSTSLSVSPLHCTARVYHLIRHSGYCWLTAAIDWSKYETRRRRKLEEFKIVAILF